MSEDFDPRRARSKRPMPVWMDAFLRDTTHMEADEVGAYFLILGALWTSIDVTLPNCPRKLSRVSRVSLRLWNSRVGKTILPLLSVERDMVTSARLKKEALYVQGGLLSQHKRRSGHKASKSLKTNNQNLTADTSPDNPRTVPTQQPNNPTYNGATHLCKIRPMDIFADHVEKTEDLKKNDEVEKKSEPEKNRGTRLSPDWFLPTEWGEWAVEYGLTNDQIKHEADVFHDHWIAATGAKATKQNWLATWRNWIRRNHSNSKGGQNGKFTNSTNRSGNSGNPAGNGSGMAGTTAADEIAARAAKWVDKKEAGG